MPNTKIDKQRLRDDFSRAAQSYDAAAVVQHEICVRTLERVDMLKLQANTIIDIGSGTGQSLKGLRTRFPASDITACDIALPMLVQCRKQSGGTGRLVCSDAEQLPFVNESAELIFSTSTIQWCADIGQFMAECLRILRPNGVLIFSTFGPDTLLQLRQSWAKVDQLEHVHEFLDMHHLGDLLLATKFSDPVVDMEVINIHYQSLRQLLRDLKDTGSQAKFNATTSTISSGLMSKEKYRLLEQAYEEHRQENGLLCASYEVIYGYACKAAHGSHVDEKGNVGIPVSSIKNKFSRAQGA